MYGILCVHVNLIYSDAQIDSLFRNPLTVRNYCVVISTVWMLALPFSTLVFLIPGQECSRNAIRGYPAVYYLWL